MYRGFLANASLFLPLQSTLGDVCSRRFLHHGELLFCLGLVPRLLLELYRRAVCLPCWHWTHCDCLPACLMSVPAALCALMRNATFRLSPPRLRLSSVGSSLGRDFYRHSTLVPVLQPVGAWRTSRKILALLPVEAHLAISFSVFSLYTFLFLQGLAYVLPALNFWLSHGS